MNEVKFNTTQPGVLLGGILHPTCLNEARLAERLWAKQGEWIAHEVLRDGLGISQSSLKSYATTLRSIFNPYGWHVESFQGKHNIGMRLFAGKNPKTDGIKKNCHCTSCDWTGRRKNIGRQPCRKCNKHTIIKTEGE